MTPSDVVASILMNNHQVTLLMLLMFKTCFPSRSTFFSNKTTGVESKLYTQVNSKSEWVIYIGCGSKLKFLGVGFNSKPLVIDLKPNFVTDVTDSLTTPMNLQILR